jgi:CheY-like chemotaxis protein
MVSDTGKSPSDTSGTGTGTGTPPIYNLVVSNSTVILSQLRWGGFRRLDLRTTVANLAGDVRRALEKATPHAVVLEGRLADGDAFDLCHEIKVDFGLGELPVVVVIEGSISKNMLPKIARSGCDEVLSAPLSRGQLYFVVADYLGLPRRRSYRVKVKARVTARGTYLELPGEIYDLAVSGARIRLQEPFSGESELVVAIEVPEGELELPAAVVWHRPYAKGAELAVQFKPVSAEVAIQLETLSTWRIEERSGQQVVVLQRNLGERSNFTGLPELLREHVVFDMRHLSMIASVGVGEWVNFLREIPEEVTYEFVHCPVTFCVQASYVSDMIGAGQVRTFYAPYFCADCNIEVERELKADDFEADEEVTPPKMRCAGCGAPMEFEDLPDRYFRFLKD